MQLRPAYAPAGVQLEWPPDNGTIRSIDVAEDNAYVGDAEGRLHWYTVGADGWHLERTTRLSRSRAVERVVVLRSVRLVLALCGA